MTHRRRMIGEDIRPWLKKPMDTSAEIELTKETANRIVGSVLWDQILSVERLHRRYLNVHVVHMVGDRLADYETQLDNGDDDDPGIDAETQLRANEILNRDGTKTIHFRIQCRFSTPINADCIIGFDQAGRIVDGLAVVDSITVVYADNPGFSTWDFVELEAGE